MKKYLIAGLAAAGFVVAASGSALTASASDVDITVGHVAVSMAELSNANSGNTASGGVGAGNHHGYQGVQYGDDTFKYMAGINSNGIGTNAGTGSSQVVISAAATVYLDRN